MKLLFLFIIVVIPSFVLAEYPSPKNNHDLRNEISNEPDRKITSSDWFVGAIDSTVFYNNPSNQYYHGIGHWTQLRTEAEVNHFLTLNSRTILFNGSMSNGYANPVGMYTLFSLKGEWPEPILGANFKVRALDLERETVGQGLLIDQKESSGVKAVFEWPGVVLSYMQDGTGMLSMGDTTSIYRMSFWNGLFSIGRIDWTSGKQEAQLSENRKPYDFISAKLSVGSLVAGVEAGARDKYGAWLASVEAKNEFSNLKISTKFQYREYFKNFGKDWVGRTSLNYVSYDQYDKDYINAQNILYLWDDVKVYGIKLDLNYKFSDRVNFGSMNEYADLQWKSILSRDQFILFRAEVNYVPLPSRLDTVTVFISNKILNQSEYCPPSKVAAGSEPLFTKAETYFGLEGKFRF